MARKLVFTNYRQRKNNPKTHGGMEPMNKTRRRLADVFPGRKITVVAQQQREFISHKTVSIPVWRADAIGYPGVLYRLGHSAEEAIGGVTEILYRDGFTWDIEQRPGIAK